MASLVRLLRSKGFIAVVVPLSSAVARSAPDLSSPHSEFTPKQIDDLLASFCASCADGGSGSRAFLVAGSDAAGRDAGVVDDSAGRMRLYELSASAAARAAPNSVQLDWCKGKVTISPLRCPGGTPCPNLDGLEGDRTARVPTEEEKRTFQELKYQLQKKLFAVSVRSKHLDIWQHNVEAEARVNAAVKSSVDDSRSELEKGKLELIQRSELFEKQRAEGKKVDKVLDMVQEMVSKEADDKKLDKLLEMVQELVSDPAKALKVEKSDVSNDGGKASEAEKENFQTKSDKLSCRLFHSSKLKIISYAKSKTPAQHLLTIARQIHNGYFGGENYYPLVFGVIVWYTSGVEANEVVEYGQVKHHRNKAIYKEELDVFRADKLAKAEALRQQEADALRQREAEALRKQEAEALRKQEAEALRQREAEALRKQEAEALRQREAKIKEGEDLAAGKKSWWPFWPFS